MDQGAYELCRADYELFAKPDWEPDCDVDLADFAAFQVCFDPDVPVEGNCFVAFERAQDPCGFIELRDSQRLIDWLQLDSSSGGCGGPLPNPDCVGFCPQGMMGGGESMAAVGGDVPFESGEFDGDAPSQPEQATTPPWTLIESPVGLEVRPVGDGDPTTALTAGIVYEVAYSGASHAVQGYSLLVTGNCEELCVMFAAPAATGVWAETGLFEALPLGEGSAADYLVFDDLPSGSSDPDPAGILCTVTPDSAGQIVLDVTLYLADLDASVTYESVGQLHVSVITP